MQAVVMNGILIILLITRVIKVHQACLVQDLVKVQKFRSSMEARKRVIEGGRDDKKVTIELHYTIIYEETKKRFSKSEYLFMILYQVYISILDETPGGFKKFSIKGRTSSMIESKYLKCNVLINQNELRVALEKNFPLVGHLVYA